MNQIYIRSEKIEDKILACRRSMLQLKRLEKENLDPMRTLLSAEEEIKEIVQQLRQEIKTTSKEQQVPEPADVVQWENIKPTQPTKLSTKDLVKDRLPTEINQAFDSVDVVLAYIKNTATTPKWTIVQTAYYNRFPEKYEGWIALNGEPMAEPKNQVHDYDEFISTLVDCFGHVRKAFKLKTEKENNMEALLEAEATARSVSQQVRQEIKTVCKRQSIPEPENITQWYENQRKFHEENC